MTENRPTRAAVLCAGFVLLTGVLSGATGCAPTPGGGDAGGARPGGTADGEPISASASAQPASYVSEILDWQAERAESLRRPEGWLALVGLHWLEEGENTFGSAETNDLVFPGGTPAEIGVLALDDGAVTLDPAPELTDAAGPVRLAIDREENEPVPVTGPVSMVPDTEEGTVRIALGSYRFWVIRRGEMIGVRVLDRESPAIEAFEGLDYFPVDPDWRVEARLEPRDGFTVPMPDVLGRLEELPSPGVLLFEVPEGEEGAGTELTLAPTESGDELFIVFGDATNGHGTYGGGRFLYADAPERDGGTVILDFNRAYNPPCAFTEFATCPLPPRQNKLGIPIPAGEKDYAGGPAH